LEKYVLRLSKTMPLETELPAGWQLLNASAMSEYLSDPKHAEASAIILDDFRRVSDIANEGTGVLTRACNKYQIRFGEAPTESIAMELFLDHPEAFEFAWSRYLLYGSNTMLIVHPLPLGHLEVTDQQLADFRNGVRLWFARQAKGEQCHVKKFDDDEEVVILIQHGTYVQTLSFWDGDEVKTTSFRPALEDVIVYEPSGEILRIKAIQANDRDEYLRLFATCIGGDESLADDAAKGEVFSLTPVEDGSFDFAGDGPIRKVELRQVKMVVFGATNLIAEFKSPNIVRSFEHDLPGFGLSSGLLVKARFRFYIPETGERPTTVTFSVEPPGTTDLAERKHSDEILRYLRKQGVRVR
jgi:hypothetical protein